MLAAASHRRWYSVQQHSLSRDSWNGSPNWVWVDSNETKQMVIWFCLFIHLCSSADINGCATGPDWQFGGWKTDCLVQPCGNFKKNSCGSAVATVVVGWGDNQQTSFFPSNFMLKPSQTAWIQTDMGPVVLPTAVLQHRSQCTVFSCYFKISMSDFFFCINV